MQIVKYPHPTLRHKSKPLRRVDKELLAIVRQMFELMYQTDGIGLAANQVDLPYRLFVLNVEGDQAKPEAEHVFINPVISKQSGLVEREEGCLSFPGIYAPVRRPEQVTVTAYNLAGEELTYRLNGLFARAAQHELDHLDGVLFIDYLDGDAKAEVAEKLAKLEADYAAGRHQGIIPAEEASAARLAELEQLRT